MKNHITIKMKNPQIEDFYFYLVSTIKLIIRLYSPSISTFENTGTQTISFPLGATYPLAIAIASKAFFCAD